MNYSPCKNTVLQIIQNDLITNGFFINDGLKYGLDLLVYTEHPQKVHSKYGLLLYNEKITYREILAYQRVCTNSNKTLLIAFYDGREIKYKSVERFI
ncbi:tRNA intron endonuclease [Nucleospora cyclopteri]